MKKRILFIKSIKSEYDSLLLERLNRNSSEAEFIPVYLDEIDIPIVNGKITVNVGEDRLQDISSHISKVGGVTLIKPQYLLDF